MAVSQVKAPGERVRRNKDQSAWKELATAARAVAPPAPEHWSERRREWWASIWRSPMAALWIESDVFNLLDLGDLMELEKKSADHHSEIRQMRTHYGLTPAARKSLFWHVPMEDEVSGDERPVAKVRRLRAVAS